MDQLIINPHWQMSAWARPYNTVPAICWKTQLANFANKGQVSARVALESVLCFNESRYLSVTKL